MATKYVRKTGSDSNNGSSPSLAYLTIGKLLGSSGMASGDTAYIGAGTYREVVTVAMTAATVETKIIADLDGSQTGDAGEVIQTAFLTNDKSAGSSLSTMNVSNKSFLTFQDMTFISGSGRAFTSSGVTTNITLRRCALISASGDTALQLDNTATAAATWTIDSCVIVDFTASAINIRSYDHTAAYSLDIVIKNSYIHGFAGYGIQVQDLFGGAGGSFGPGGVTMIGCVIAGTSQGVNTTGTNTTFPVTVKSSFVTSVTGLKGSTGQVIEDYNMILAAIPRSSVSAGTHSTIAYAPMVDIGQSWLHGFAPRPFLSPMAGSSLLGFGDDGTAPSVDALNRPRPAGGNSTSKAVGYLERHDTAIKETGTVDAGGVGINITGPGDHDFLIPVDASSTTISVKARYDSTHAATNKPQAILLDNAAIGVTTETKTMTAAVDTWETLTFTAQTPSAKGVVTVRLVSRAAAANGKAFFDSFGVA